MTGTHRRTIGNALPDRPDTRLAGRDARRIDRNARLGGSDTPPDGWDARPGGASVGKKELEIREIFQPRHSLLKPASRDRRAVSGEAGAGGGGGGGGAG